MTSTSKTSASKQHGIHRGTATGRQALDPTQISASVLALAQPATGIVHCCNAGTTTSDALWTGLPVLTCQGGSFASRMAASLLTAIDLPELITKIKLSLKPWPLNWRKNRSASQNLELQHAIDVLHGQVVSRPNQREQPDSGDQMRKTHLGQIAQHQHALLLGIEHVKNCTVASSNRPTA